MKQERKMGFQWFKMLTKKQQKYFRLSCHRQEGIEYFNLSLNNTLTFGEFIGFAICSGKPMHNFGYWDRIYLNK